MLRLLENPVHLEHEAFAEFLRAVFHLTEEVEKRGILQHFRRLTGKSGRGYQPGICVNRGAVA